MSPYLYILLLPAAWVMSVSDVRRREVGVAWLVIFAVTVLSVSVSMFGWRLVAMNVCDNVSVLGFMALAVWGYLRVRYRGKGRRLNTFIGAGDAVFLVSITPLFGMREFLWFLIISFCVTLAGWWLFTVITRRMTTIPLVATLSLSLAVYIIHKSL